MKYKDIIKTDPESKGLCSRNSSTKIKDSVYVINLDEYKSRGTVWITLYVNDDNIAYFDNFGVEHNIKEFKKFIGNKNIKRSIYRI